MKSEENIREEIKRLTKIIKDPSSEGWFRLYNEGKKEGLKWTVDE